LKGRKGVRWEFLTRKKLVTRVTGYTVPIGWVARSRGQIEQTASSIAQLGIQIERLRIVQVMSWVGKGDIGGGKDAKFCGDKT